MTDDIKQVIARLREYQARLEKSWHECRAHGNPPSLEVQNYKDIDALIEAVETFLPKPMSEAPLDRDNPAWDGKKGVVS